VLFALAARESQMYANDPMVILSSAKHEREKHSLFLKCSKNDITVELWYQETIITKISKNKPSAGRIGNSRTLQFLSAQKSFNTKYKKFELMLTRHVKAYSSSCSQTVSLSPAILSQFILRVCAAAKDHKIQ